MFLSRCSSRVPLAVTSSLGVPLRRWYDCQRPFAGLLIAFISLKDKAPLAHARTKLSCACTSLLRLSHSYLSLLLVPLSSAHTPLALPLLCSSLEMVRLPASVCWASTCQRPFAGLPFARVCSLGFHLSTSLLAASVRWASFVDIFFNGRRPPVFLCQHLRRQPASPPQNLLPIRGEALFYIH